MKAYALAAGYATRLHPLTKRHAKPLLDVAGAPILSHILSRVVALDELTEIVVVGNHRFNADLTTWADAFRAQHLSESSIGLRVLDDGSTSDLDKLGAIGDIAFALRSVPPHDEDWLVVAGDNLLDFDLRTLQGTFNRHHEPLLALRDVPVSHAPTSYNEVTLGADGRVTRFREKPPEALTGLAAIALYFFPAQTARLVEAYLEAGGNPDAPGHFIAWLVDQTNVRGMHFEGGWFDIGSRETLERARSHYRPG